MNFGVSILFCCLLVGLPDDSRSWWEELIGIFLPAPVDYILSLRHDVSCLSPALHADKSPAPAHLHRLDAIFERAGERTTTLAEQCFVAAVASMTHKTIPLKWGIHIPLTIENDDTYRRRYRALPFLLFDDTPPEGDADKAQHFFAAAWLALQTDNPPLSSWIGEIIEKGEDTMVAGEEYDIRDIRANNLGIMFAQDRLRGRVLPPSWYFLNRRAVLPNHR